MLRKDALDEREADFYEALYTQSQAQFGAYVRAGTLVNNYAHIFDLLIRLRQACCARSCALACGLGMPAHTVQDIQQRLRQQLFAIAYRLLVVPHLVCREGQAGGNPVAGWTCNADCCMLPEK